MLPHVAPSTKIEAYKVPRLAIATLDIQTLVDDYVSKGIPVVLTGFNASADHAKWERQKAAAAAAAARDRQRDDFPEYRSSEAVVCQTPACNSVLQSDGSKQQDVSALEGVQTIHQTMPNPGFVTLGGVLFTGTGGALFGGPVHFDSTCNPVMNLQMQGVKDWTLWSPSVWQVGPFQGKMLPPHTRFVTTLHEGDALLFAPAFYHGTKIHHGEQSVATSTDIVGLPVYSSLKAGFYKGHPFGYEHCGKNAWKPFNEELAVEMRSLGGPLFKYQRRDTGQGKEL